MQGDQKERWLELCELAANEHDNDKLLKLVREISRALSEKEQRFGRRPDVDGRGDTG